MAKLRTESIDLDGIRQILSEGIRDLRAGTSSPANINALSNATGKILSSVKLEMEYFKAIGRRPHIAMMAALDSPEEAPATNGTTQTARKVLDSH